MKTNQFSRSRFVVRTLVLAAVLPLAWTTLSVATGCGDDLSESSTSGQRVTLQTRVEAGDDLSVPFTNAPGWTIELSRVLVSTGELYYFDGDPPDLAMRNKGARPSPWGRSLERWVGIPLAHAHPGHYQAGNAMGQMLAPSSVDLLAGPTTLSAGEGVTGAYRSASFFFHNPPVGPFASDLGTHVVLVEGQAQKGEETRKFRASAEPADVTNANGNTAIEACEFTPADVASDGTVVVKIKPSVWLNQVDFTNVPDSDSFEDLPAGGAAQQAFTLLGVTRASAYMFTFEGAR